MYRSALRIVYTEGAYVRYGNEHSGEVPLQFYFLRPSFFTIVLYWRLLFFSR